MTQRWFVDRSGNVTDGPISYARPLAPAEERPTPPRLVAMVADMQSPDFADRGRMIAAAPALVEAAREVLRLYNEYAITSSNPEVHNELVERMVDLQRAYRLATERD